MPPHPDCPTYLWQSGSLREINVQQQCPHGLQLLWVSHKPAQTAERWTHGLVLVGTQVGNTEPKLKLSL